MTQTITQTQNATNTASQAIHPQATQVLGTIQMLVPSSFNKKFGNVAADNLVLAISLCLDGLTDEQIALGIHTVRDKGFCPDPALFRRFCLGQGDFNNTDTIADSYIGKHGALNAIIKWQNDPSTQITVAMKQAYDETYTLWQNIHSQSDSIRAELAFKDVYEHIVNGLVSERIACLPYKKPKALATPKEPAHTPADRDTALAFLDKIKANIAKARLEKGAHQ